MQAPPRKFLNTRPVDPTLPSSLPELLRTYRAKHRISQRGLSGYLGMQAKNSVNRWESGAGHPDYDSCIKIADYTGYPLAFVLRLAGHPPAPEDESGPAQAGLLSVDVIPEIGVVLKRYGPQEQQRFLRLFQLATELHEERGPYDAGSPATPPAKPPAGEDPADPQQ